MSLRIGICDSGIGGFSVLEELYKTIPAEYVYIGDSLRAPYGNKTHEELVLYTRELLSFLKHKDVDMYVSACNSISTVDTTKILTDLAIPQERYFDMKSFMELCIRTLPQEARVLIYGTVATVSSGVYQELCKDYTYTTLASSRLAYAIETGNLIDIDEEIDTLVDVLLQNRSTHLILACTHYPLIMEYLEKRLQGMEVTIINPATYIPEQLKSHIGEYGSLQIFTTKESEVFTKQSEKFPHAEVSVCNLTLD